MRSKWSLSVLLIILTFLPLHSSTATTKTVRIGFNLALTGNLDFLGVAAREGAEILKEQINQAGGIVIGKTSYPVEYVYVDNQSGRLKGVEAALRLISKENVLGLIGPNASSQAIPAGGIANSFQIPMICPASTNPKTTFERPFVFRSCFLDSYQGDFMADFAISDLGAKKAAILFNIASAYPKGLAEFFRNGFEVRRGKGAVVAYEDFLSNETDFSKHLERIVASEADVLFIPQYATEVPALVSQARAMGWQKPILGGSAWESASLVARCGEQCKGLFFSSHFGASGSTGKTGAFVELFHKKYGRLPSSFSALAYDAVDLMLTAIGNLNKLEGNLLVDRANIKEEIAKLKGFTGVTGIFDMDASGDPRKSGVIIRITNDGKFESYKIQTP